MAISIDYMYIHHVQFPEFDIRKDPETVYACFVKCAQQFKNNHLKAYNIMDKAQKRLLFLDSIGKATLDIFEQLSNTGTDLDRALMHYETSSRNLRTGCTTYTNFTASNKERTKLGIRSSRSLEQKASIVTSWRVGWIP